MGEKHIFSSQVSRRDVLKIGVAGGLSLFLKGCGVDSRKPGVVSSPTTDVNTPTAEPIDQEAENSKNYEIVLTRAKQLFKDLNFTTANQEQEKQIWTRSYEVLNQLPNNLTIEDSNASSAYIREIWTAMKNSQNPHLVNAMETHKELVTSAKFNTSQNFGGLKYGVAENMTLPTAISFYLEGNTLKQQLDVNMLLLRYLAPPELGVLFAHEYVHLKDYGQIIQDMQRDGVFPQEQLKKLERSFSVELEAKGYAEQANAFIYEVALGLKPALVRSDHSLIAAKFITFGEDSNAFKWQQFIAENRMQLTDWKPGQIR